MIRFNSANVVLREKRYSIEHAQFPDFDIADVTSTIKRSLAILSHQACRPLQDPEIAISSDGTFARLYGKGYSVTWGNSKLLPLGLPLTEYKKLLQEQEALLIKIKYAHDTLG
jgi:hypothetical protein